MQLTTPNIKYSNIKPINTIAGLHTETTEL